MSDKKSVKMYAGMMDDQKSRYGERFFVKYHGLYHCFFKGCKATLRANFSRHIAVHEKQGDEADIEFVPTSSAEATDDAELEKSDSPPPARGKRSPSPDQDLDSAPPLKRAQTNKMELLNEIRNKQNRLDRLKMQLEHFRVEIKSDGELLQEYLSEKKLLKEEHERRAKELSNILEDIKKVDELIKGATKERDLLNKRYHEVQEREYLPLKDDVDSKRASLGLERLPTLSEIEDRNVNKYLEERCKNWEKESKQTGE